MKTLYYLQGLFICLERVMVVILSLVGGTLFVLFLYLVYYVYKETKSILDSIKEF